MARHVSNIQERVNLVVAETRKPKVCARHNQNCMSALRTMFKFLSHSTNPLAVSRQTSAAGAAEGSITNGEETKLESHDELHATSSRWKECVAVAESGFRLSFPVLFLGSEEFSSSPGGGVGTSSSSESSVVGLNTLNPSVSGAAVLFPTRLANLVVQRAAAAAPPLPLPIVSVRFSVRESEAMVKGLTAMCRFDVAVRVEGNSGRRVFPLVRSSGMAKACFSLSSKVVLSQCAVVHSLCGIL